MHERQVSATVRGRPGTSSTGVGAMCRSRAACIWAPGSEVWYGECPVSIWYSRTPRAYTSSAGLAALLTRRVGSGWRAASTDSAWTVIASPKSMIFGPDSVTMMFAGVRSRCTTPRRCAMASTSAMVAASRTASGHGSAPPASRPASIAPDSSSMATYGTVRPSGSWASPKS
ncbi:MAG: hypothetical protein AUI14_26055 [Actinobacteria bacterium 13_2_20CM_2_71_6]|nr:MAG: hypothetical protein AUI14_26055 [Actinobacteria bacterium 13_2_20CM_2_71_6]